MIYETVVAIKDDEDDSIMSYLVDNKHYVPLDENNTHYVELMKRVADGTVVIA